MFDPEVLQILGLNLLAQKSPNFGENLGNAGLATMQYQRQREEDKYRKEEREFLKQQREMQIQELQRQQRMRQEQDNLYRQFVQPGQPSRPYVDTLGDQPPQADIPAVPPKMDVEGYMAALPMLGPQGIEMAVKLRKDMNDYMSVPEGGAVFNKSTGENVFSNPKIQKTGFANGVSIKPHNRSMGN